MAAELIELERKHISIRIGEIFYSHFMFSLQHTLESRTGVSNFDVELLYSVVEFSHPPSDSLLLSFTQSLMILWEKKISPLINFINSRWQILASVESDHQIHTLSRIYLA